MADPKKRSKISVIVMISPGISVDSLVPELMDSLHSLRRPFELILVDDATTDSTFSMLRRVAQKEKRIRVIRLRTRSGEAGALEAGLRCASGSVVVYMNAQVRVNPKGIPLLIHRLDEGADFVIGYRFPRRDSFLNRWVSFGFNWLVSRITQFRFHDVHSGIFATRREVLNHIRFYGDMVHFIPLLAGQQGYQLVEQKIEQLPGKFRQSKYPKEYMQRLLDILTVFFLTRYSKKPIHFMGFVGIVFALVGLAIEIYLFIYRILGLGAIAGRPLLLLGALLLVIGIQMISIGLIGEMIIFTHADTVKEYNIEEIINE